jgi:glutamate-ammonia-ligase adenylyltransferase
VARDALREIERRAGAAQAAGAASRIERFFHQARTRTGLKRLVDKEPDWLESVLPALVRSSLVSGLLAHQPSLVDFLPRKGGIWSDFSAWLDRAQSIVRGCAGYEEAVEWIRRLKNERMLLLALTDLQGGLHVRELMGELSLLADFVVQTTLDCIARHVAGSTDLPLAVLGLGKLGSRELGYYSDLDLMFVYEPDKAGEQERIPERIVRLIQRFMRMLSTPLQEGPGYEIDAELRPTGNYGPLVVTRQKWESYYAREADLWEVQALLRMRRVAGDERLGKHLEEYAASLCYSPRTPSGVWPRLCHLRARMEEERAQERQGAINMKLGPGGLADLEFLVQGHQLILGHENRILRGGAFSDMLLEVLRSCGLAEESVRALHSVYYTYRSLEQRLQHLSNVRSAHLTGEQLQAMTDRGLWPPEQRLLAVEGWTDLLQMRRRVREVWKRTCDAKEGS